MELLETLNLGPGGDAKYSLYKAAEPSPGTFYIRLLMLPPYISSRMLSALFFVFMVPVIVIPASAFYAV